MRIAAKEWVLEFAALSDIRIVVAFWIGVVSTLLAVIILLQVLLMRIALTFRERRSSRYREVAKNWLIRFIAGEAMDAPKMARCDLPDFLYQWIHFQEMLTGDSKVQLKQALSGFSLESRVHKLLRNGNFEEQLIAATALGHLGDKQAWGQLLALLNKPSPLLSMTAARALVLIDPDKARDIVLPLIIKHRDWMPIRSALMLKQADPQFQKAYLTLLDCDAQQPPPYLLRLMRLLSPEQINQPLSFVREYLMNSDDPNLIAACLRLVCHPSELELVRGQFDNEHWTVQVQIAAVLARIGAPKDVHYLLSLLNSGQWWVRYRAARALIELPFINRRAIKRLIDSRSDVFARDILLQIVAEKVRR